MTILPNPLRGIVAIAAALVLWASAGIALADRRVALVVGNSSYQKVTPLPNPANDANDVSDLLQSLGFQIIRAIDADHIGFDRALAEFSRRAIDADAALFFYAGHGIQLKGQNYLLPIDADAKDEVSAQFDFVALDRVRAALDRAAPSAVRIMILDACRDNPLARTIAQATRGVGAVATRGLARIDLQSQGGVVVVYATQANQVAQDGAERNSPFTSSLLLRLKEPGLELGALFRRVTNDVQQKTGGRQIPELSISLGQDYYLNRNETDAVAFDRIVDSQDPNDFLEFLARYPGSARAPLARRMAEMLESNTAQRRRDSDDALGKAEQERKAAEAARAERLRAEEARVAALERARVEQARRDQAAQQERERAAEANRLAEGKRQRAEAERAKEAAEALRLAEDAKRAAEAAEAARIQAAREAETARREPAGSPGAPVTASTVDAQSSAPADPHAAADQHTPAVIAAASAPTVIAPQVAADAPPPSAAAPLTEADRRTAELIAAQAKARETMRLVSGAPIASDSAPAPIARGGHAEAIAIAALASGERSSASSAPVNTPALVRAAQAELKRLRCYLGLVDGQFSPSTVTALAEYARAAQRAPLTGVDDALVTELKAKQGRLCGAAPRRR